MYTSRNYNIGDRVFVMVKGDPGQNSGLARQIGHLNRNQFDGNAQRREPLYLAEGVVTSFRNSTDANGRVLADDPQMRRVGVCLFPYEEIMWDETVYHEYELDSNNVENALSILMLAVGKQITTEEQWKFAVRFLFPETVVEQGYNRLLGDLVSAFNPTAAGDAKAADRDAIIAQANALGFAVRLLPRSGSRGKWRLDQTQLVNEAVGRFTWSAVAAASGFIPAAPAPVAPQGGF